MILDSIKISGINYKDFTINNFSNITIKPNLNFSIDINFIPTLIGSKSAVIELFTDSKPASSAKINLKAVKEISSFKLSTDTVDFGNVEQGKLYEMEFWIINDGSIDLNWKFPIISDNFKSLKLLHR